jgi:hypothetical protein
MPELPAVSGRPGVASRPEDGSRTRFQILGPAADARSTTCRHRLTSLARLTISSDLVNASPAQRLVGHLAGCGPHPRKQVRRVPCPAGDQERQEELRIDTPPS